MDKIVDLRFADKLKEYRKVLGITQTILANILGVVPSTVNHWENGKVVPTKAKQRRALGILKAERDKSMVANIDPRESEILQLFFTHREEIYYQSTNKKYYKSNEDGTNVEEISKVMIDNISTRFGYGEESEPVLPVPIGRAPVKEENDFALYKRGYEAYKKLFEANKEVTEINILITKLEGELE